MKNRYSQYELAILGTTFFTEGGDWRSIYLYARKEEARGRKIVIINPRSKRGLRQTLAVWAFARRVVVNALASFDSWLVLSMCLARNDVHIYLHETEYALDSYKQLHPLRYQLLAFILSRNPVFCVSKKAEFLYRDRFGSKITHVVYECPEDCLAEKLDTNFVHIVNVGSLNERKGVDFFSRVADLAEEKHPKWRFHWVGGVATMSQLYRSPNVTWHGFMWHPNELVKQCMVFFLSSIDDPCPLSAIEALQAGIGCVVYKKTGTEELLYSRSDCGVYHEYTPQSALRALENVLCRVKHIPQENKLDSISYTAFASRIDSALDA
jgi:glycosyltransferase involved in cell wall biosynthesis